MRLLVPIAIVCCLTQAEAAITLQQLESQHLKTQAALLQYNIASDALINLESQQQAALNRWQALRQLSLLYFEAGDLQRGTLFATAASAEQAEYERITAILPMKRADVEVKWQTYLKEKARFDALKKAYDEQ